MFMYEHKWRIIMTKKPTWRVITSSEVFKTSLYAHRQTLTSSSGRELISTNFGEKEISRRNYASKTHHYMPKHHYKNSVSASFFLLSGWFLGAFLPTAMTIFIFSLPFLLLTTHNFILFYESLQVTNFQYVFTSFSLKFCFFFVPRYI